MLFQAAHHTAAQVIIHLFHIFVIYQYAGINAQQGHIASQLLNSIVQRLHIFHLAFIIGIHSQQNESFLPEHIVKLHRLYVLAGHTVSVDITLSPSVQLQKYMSQFDICFHRLYSTQQYIIFTKLHSH